MLQSLKNRLNNGPQIDDPWDDDEDDDGDGETMKEFLFFMANFWTKFQYCSYHRASDKETG